MALSVVIVLSVILLLVQLLYRIQSALEEMKSPDFYDSGAKQEYSSASSSGVKEGDSRQSIDALFPDSNIDTNEDIDERVIPYLGFVLLIVLLVLIGPPILTSYCNCYKLTVWNRSYNAETVAEYTKIVDNFRNQGILKAETCELFKKTASEKSFDRRNKLRKSTM